jgi:hypothetical protein
MFTRKTIFAASAALSMFAAVSMSASASTGEQPPAGRLFTNPASNMCLDVPGITNRTPGTALQLYDCETNGFEVGGKQSDQFWVFAMQGQIRNTLSGLCIDIGGTDEGAALEVRACSASPSQIWIVRQDGFIQNQATGKCIGLGENDNEHGETPLQLSSCEFADPQSDQRFSI